MSLECNLNRLRGAAIAALARKILRSGPSLLWIILLPLLLLVDLMLTVENILHNLLRVFRLPRVAIAKRSFHRRCTPRFGKRISIVILRIAAVLIVQGRLRASRGAGKKIDLQRSVSVAAPDDEYVV